MGLYRRGKIWWMSYTVDGIPYRESTQTRNKGLAERAYAKTLTDVEEGRWFERQAKSKTLGEMIAKYSEEYTKHKEYYSQARDKSIFKHLERFFGMDCMLGHVERTIGSYEQFRKTGENSAQPATILKELALLRRMFNIARKNWKWKMTNPVSEIDLPEVHNERVRYLSPDELVRLLEAVHKIPEKWLEPLVRVALNTGLRLTNLCELRWSEVELPARIIKIAAVQMKNKKYLGIPINDEAYGVLKEAEKVRGLSDFVFHDNGEPLYDRKVQRAFVKAVKIAGIEDFHFHDLRHTFASYLRQQGVDLGTIGELLGHADMRMAKRYAHLHVGNLNDAVSKLSFTNLSQSVVISFAKQVVPTGVEPVS